MGDGSDPDLWQLPSSDAEVVGGMRHIGKGVWVPDLVQARSEPPHPSRTRAQVIGLVITLASPILWSGSHRASGNLYDSAMGVLSNYLENLAAGDQTAHGRLMKKHARRLRSLWARWTYSDVLPPAVVAAARDFLEAAGVPSPPEGWNAFSGDSIPGEVAAAAERFAHGG